MPICLLVLAESQSAQELHENLHKAKTPLSRCQLIRPKSKGNELSSSEGKLNVLDNFPRGSNSMEVVEIETIKLLNPKLDRNNRQRTMAFWLMPFGFFAGLTFSQMTGLRTFSGLGLGPIGEPLIGSILGMASGWLGSFVAAASVNTGTSDDLRNLLRRNEEGLWLMLIETPFEVDLPWQLVQEVQPLEIHRLQDL